MGRDWKVSLSAAKILVKVLLCAISLFLSFPFPSFAFENFTFRDFFWLVSLLLFIKFCFSGFLLLGFSLESSCLNVKSEFCQKNGFPFSSSEFPLLKLESMLGVFLFFCFLGPSAAFLLSQPCLGPGVAGPPQRHFPGLVRHVGFKHTSRESTSSFADTAVC